MDIRVELISEKNIPPFGKVRIVKWEDVSGDCGIVSAYYDEDVEIYFPANTHRTDSLMVRIKESNIYPTANKYSELISQST